MFIPRWVVPAVIAAALAGCGGGNTTAPSLSSVTSVNSASTAPSTPPTGGFTAMVVFGDSLSDNGAYTPAAMSAYSNAGFTGTLPYVMGGQFTVNPGPIWVTDVATSLGLSLSPNVVGYGGTYITSSWTPSASPVYCPFANCTDFAEGGSMISNASGIGHGSGALTIPVTQQLQNYLTQFSRFNSGQLVTMLAGNNDIFTALATVQAEVGSGVTQTVAVAQAQATVAGAADQLAGVAKTILADGASYEVVYTLPDSSVTPFGQSLTGGSTCDNRNASTPCYLLSNLVQVFNQRLIDDLQGSGVKMLDGYALLGDEVANPAKYGLTNASSMWCDPTLTSNTSLVCNANTPNTTAGASTSNLGTWLFADDVHPTPAGHQIIASATLAAMRGFGWIH